jgi:hypothetical protein
LELVSFRKKGKIPLDREAEMWPAQTIGGKKDKVALRAGGVFGERGLGYKEK